MSRDRGFRFFAILTAVVCVVTIQFIFLKAPTEQSMGIVQKIFYFHVPAAFGMYLGAAACLVGSIGYLARGTLKWDALARAGAEVAVCMGLMVMISGPLWAAKAWGKYWTWDPRLTTSMLSLLVYVAYTVLRNFTASGDAERKFAAALGILGAANIPIIRYSVHKWGGQHPRVITGDGGGLSHPDMSIAFALGSFTLLAVGIILIWHRLRIHVATCRLDALEQEAIELGLTED